MTVNVMSAGQIIAKRIFNEMCIHSDDGYCDLCISEYLPEWINTVVDQAKEEGYHEGRLAGLKEANVIVKGKI